MTRFAEQWTAGLLQPGHEGPLPWWLADHRIEWSVSGGYDINTDTMTPQVYTMVRSTHPQHRAFVARWE